MVFNIYILRKTRINTNENKSADLKEEEILTRADVILKKYLNK